MNREILFAAALLSGCTSYQVKHPERSLAEKSAYLAETLKEREPVLISQHGLDFRLEIKSTHLGGDIPENLEKVNISYLEVEVTRVGQNFPNFLIFNSHPYSVLGDTFSYLEPYDLDMVVSCSGMNVSCKNIRSENVDSVSLYRFVVEAAYNKSTCKEYGLPPSVVDSFENLVKENE